MIDEATGLFVQGSRALIVATVSEDGAPHATRGWGITLDGDGDTARVLLPASDAVALAALAHDGARIAVTAGDVETLRSTQLKGRCTGVEPADENDAVTNADYIEGFFAAIERADGTPRSLLERLVPGAYVAVTITIDELYDQTPGPGAGALVDVGR